MSFEESLHRIEGVSDKQEQSAERSEKGPLDAGFDDPNPGETGEAYATRIIEGLTILTENEQHRTETLEAHAAELGGNLPAEQVAAAYGRTGDVLKERHNRAAQILGVGKNAVTKAVAGAGSVASLAGKAVRRDGFKDPQPTEVETENTAANAAEPAEKSKNWWQRRVEAAKEKANQKNIGLVLDNLAKSINQAGGEALHPELVASSIKVSFEALTGTTFNGAALSPKERILHAAIWAAANAIDFTKLTELTDDVITTAVAEGLEALSSKSGKAAPVLKALGKLAKNNPAFIGGRVRQLLSGISQQGARIREDHAQAAANNYANLEPNAPAAEPQRPAPDAPTPQPGGQL